MKELTLYIDKWYIIGAVCTDGVPRLVIPDNKEDRYWLYFYEDTTNNEIVYGKDNQSHYRNNEPHYYGDIFSKMTQSDSHFLYYNRKQELCDIFKASRILASLRESMALTETEMVETYVSFSKDISDDARFLFLTKVLGQNHFHVKESVARIEHLTLEHSVRNNKLKDDGFVLVLNACNENLHVSLFKKQGKDCVLQNEMVLDGYGRDLRSRALLENVVGCINQRTNFLSSSSDLEKEYLRQEPEIDNWLVKLDNAKNGRPISLNNISFSGMTNQYAVMVLKNDIDSRTHVIVDNVVREIDSFVKKSKVNNNEVQGVVFLGNTFTNKQFLESIRSYYILDDENYLFYRETELPNIIGVYSVIDCSQFSAETKAVMANGELELVRKQRAKEEKDRMDEAKRRNQEQQEKDKEVREAELRYNEAMETVAAFEKKFSSDLFFKKSIVVSSSKIYLNNIFISAECPANSLCIPESLFFASSNSLSTSKAFTSLSCCLKLFSFCCFINLSFAICILLFKTSSFFIDNAFSVHSTTLFQSSSKRALCICSFNSFHSCSFSLNFILSFFNCAKHSVHCF